MAAQRKKRKENKTNNLNFLLLQKVRKGKNSHAVLGDSFKDSAVLAGLFFPSGAQFHLHGLRVGEHLTFPLRNYMCFTPGCWK